MTLLEDLQAQVLEIRNVNPTLVQEEPGLRDGEWWREGLELVGSIGVGRDTFPNVR
jgi:hypothetical protein